MITDARKEILNDLVFKASVAGNKDIFDMSEQEFSEEIKQDEEWIVYKEFSKQRKIGFENYANQIKQEIQEILSSEELHFMADIHNYDDGTFLLEQIIENPNCAIETAQMIYWLSSPDYYYDKFGGPEYCDEEYNKEFADLLVKINNRANGIGFVLDSGIILSEEMDGYIKSSQLDYEKEVYSKTPKIEIDKFKSMSESLKKDYIESFELKDEHGKIIKLLTEIGIENLNTELLGKLARAYNNSDQIEKAMEIQEMIPESERDAIWYYRYGYSYAYRTFPVQPMEDIMKALELFEKAIEKSDDDKVISWCVEIVEACMLGIVLEKNKDKMPLLYKYFMQNNIKSPDEEAELTDDSEEQEYRDYISGLYSIDWIFDKHKYSKEEFTKKFNKIMIERNGIKWWDTNVNATLEEPEILVLYEAWIESISQLYGNERLNEQDELLEEYKEDGMWQVEIMAYLKSDNGKFFTVDEFLFKLQNLMANKELGDHVFFEGIDYVGHECEGNGLIDNEDGIPVFYVACGS